MPGPRVHGDYAMGGGVEVNTKHKTISYVCRIRYTYLGLRKSIKGKDH